MENLRPKEGKERDQGHLAAKRLQSVLSIPCVFPSVHIYVSFFCPILYILCSKTGMRWMLRECLSNG